MSDDIASNQIREWIDDEIVGTLEQIPDDAAEFNITVEISNILIHIVRRQPDGPLLIGQQIEYGDDIRSRIQNLPQSDRNVLLTRIRETLTAAPVMYGFHDERGNNVAFRELHRIFLEHRIYPDEVSQHSVMSGLIAVWKTMRYLDDIITLIDSVEEQSP